MPKPYQSDAAVPASAAGQTLSPAVLPLARMATPTNPPTSPIRRRGPMRSPKNRNATRAVNITVMALVMAPMPAGARSAPQANRANRMTELMAAMPAMRSHSAGVNCARAAQSNGNSTSAPSPRRASTSGNGPKSAAATRMKRNEPPQMAPSSVSSSGVRHGESWATADAPGAETAGVEGAAGVAVAAAVVVHSDADMRLKSPPVQNRSVSQALKRGRAGSSPATRYLRRPFDAAPARGPRADPRSTRCRPKDAATRRRSRGAPAPRARVPHEKSSQAG